MDPENVIGLKLEQVLPKCFFNGGFEGSKAFACKDTEIVQVYTHEPWPGPQRRVTVWYALSNHRAVGINNGRNHKTTFPVIRWR